MNRRKGVQMVIAVIVGIVIMVTTAVIVMQVTRGAFLDLDVWTKSNIESSTINTCETKVKSYCRLSDDNTDWGNIYAECEKHKDVISDNDPPDTLCGSVN